MDPDDDLAQLIEILRDRLGDDPETLTREERIARIEGGLVSDT